MFPSHDAAPNLCAALCRSCPADKDLSRPLEPTSTEKVGKSGRRKLHSGSSHGTEQNFGFLHMPGSESKAVARRPWPADLDLQAPGDMIERADGGCGLSRGPGTSSPAQRPPSAPLSVI
jgi:hypothetical protein